jgi:glutaredoxin
LPAKLTPATVIIFSKTYCPFSLRAKGVLLEKYVITPEPFVVELDEHPIGAHLQDELKEKTGRGTVPNILINGISIGGADDIIEMDNADKLMDNIRELGGKRVEIAERLGTGT